MVTNLEAHMNDETSTTEVQPAQPDGPRRLYRSRDDRVLAGVAGGLGRYFNVDPILFRIGFVALLFFGGISAILYGAAWLFVPDEGGDSALDPRRRGRVMTFAGAVVIGFALLALLGALGNWGWGLWWGGFIGPLALIAIGGLLVWAFLRDRRPGAEGVDGRWLVGRAALGIAILAASALLFFGSALATAAGGGVAVAAIVIAIGALLVVAAFRGGARWLIVPALLLAFPAGVVSAADFDLDGGVGEREYLPASAGELHDTYQLGVGRLELDLRALDLPPGDRHVKIDLGVGSAEVIVPEDMCVALDSRVGAGYARLFDRDSGGLDVDWDTTPPAPPKVTRLVLDADVGMGALFVVHHPSDVNDDTAGGAGNDACAGVRSAGGTP
jgi:phage shock protein PspC (stress-responsive transcriptional regulator)/predicted membrane protein